jgi:capsular polysaccharide biosynthesis protein
MQSLLSRYALLARHWAGLVVIGIVICGGASYIVSKLTSPVYQASTILVVIDPINPKPLQNAGIDALVGLGLAIAIIFMFEWINDRLSSIEEVQDLL